jgi:hypothetical protein
VIFTPFLRRARRLPRRFYADPLRVCNPIGLRRAEVHR